MCGFVDSHSKLKHVRRSNIAFWVSVALFAVLPAQVASAQSFRNCKTLKAKYPNGVAINFGVIGTSGAEINRAVYLRNQRLDRDKDGIICEDKLKQNPPTTTTTIPLTCTQGGRCKVGDTGPGGGIVFFATNTNQIWGQALEAAPQSISWNAQGLDPRALWGCRGISIPAARGSGIGQGRANTLAIVKECALPGSGPQVAEGLSIGGKDDWFLPSIEELRLLYTFRGFVPGLSVGGYWSSTESDADRALVGGFDDGIIGGSGWKDNAFFIRPIRYIQPISG